jgi:hypothetical protein
VEKPNVKLLKWRSPLFGDTKIDKSSRNETCDVEKENDEIWSVLRLDRRET